MNTHKIYISERFRRAVTLHIVKNLIIRNIIHAPLLLGIHGTSGDGKTFQCEYVLQEIGAKSFLISGGQLESHAAGEPAQLIRKTYLDAGKSLKRGECNIAVILINDIDTGLGNWGDMVQYTINRQTVFGELMHLVDYPTSVEGYETERIPIILTGNDFTKLYEPLVRAGRMAAFEWIPTLEERVEIVSSLFPYIKKENCAKLIEILSNEMKTVACKSAEHFLSIAFFSHLKSSLIDEQLWKEIRQTGINKTISLIRKGYLPEISFEFNFDQILKAGKKLVASGQLINHLTIN